MATRERRLHVALQDGFDDEPVLVRVDGEEVYRREAVRTDYRISLADSFDHPVPDDSVMLEVTLPRRGLSDSLRVDVGATPHVGISCVDGAIRWRPSSEPFGYV
ncbi:MAG: hypothetical protein ABFS34_14215 [Gemmatimonadota bacterium]